MLKTLDKMVIFKKILIYTSILFYSYSLSNIEINNNYFIFIVPFIFFCFLNDKKYGYFSFFIAYFFMGFHNKLFYLLFSFALIGVLFLKYFNKINNKKIANILSFCDFFVVFIMGIVTELINESNNFFVCFLLSVISYWIMRYFIEIYMSIHMGEERYFTSKLGVFILFILGVCFLGVNISFSYINISLIFIILLSFIGGKISLETGVLYCFLMSIIMFFNGSNEYNLILFLLASICVVLLNKTSKITLLFTYIFIVFCVLHYLDINYFYSINYILGAVFYFFIPKSFITEFSKMCYGSEKYIEKVSFKNKKDNMEIANKIMKMEEVYSLVYSKIKEKNRIKKSDKELLVEEINIFDKLLKEFAKDVRMNVENRYCHKVEKEIYKYGFDMLYFDIDEDIFRNKIIKLNVRCEKKDIENIISKIVSKTLKQKFKVISLKINDIFGYYEVVMKSQKNICFSFWVGQKAKDKFVCGDSYLVYENNSKQIFALSDGMGTGLQAKNRSKMALDLLKKFMDIGFDEKNAITSINCILKREYSKESYATLDLFVYDKLLEECYFYKNGACSSYVVNDGGITSVSGDELPIGIMDKIEIKKNDIKLNDGDYVIMVSDGVSEMKLNALNKIKNSDCQKIVREILDLDEEISDDETVIVIAIKK